MANGKHTLSDLDGKTFDAIIIGSGFGGAVAVDQLIEKGYNNILILERGGWWNNPEGPALPRKPKSKLPARLNVIDEKTQYWPRPNDSRGINYVVRSIYKEINGAWDAINPFVKDTDIGLWKNRSGLYRITRFTSDKGKVDVVSASGVGGGSLIYSGVNLIPSKATLDRIGLGHLQIRSFNAAGEWMERYRGRINKINTKVPVPHRVPAEPEPNADVATKAKYLERFQLVKFMGGSPPANATPPSYEAPDPELEPLEENYLLLDRSRTLKLAKKRVEAEAGFAFKVDGRAPTDVSELRPLPLSIVEYDPSPSGESAKKHAFCLREGRCITGCLPSARHTLYKSLQDRALGVPQTNITVLPSSKVSRIAYVDNNDVTKGYRVDVTSFLEDEDGTNGSVSAPLVFVSAGCLGTNEILLRSRAEGLPLGPSVGKGFSTNGDFFGFAVGVDAHPKSVPHGELVGKPHPTVGPINTSGFHLRYAAGGGEQIEVHVEDAGIPSMFARFLHDLLPLLDGKWSRLVKMARATLRALVGKEPYDFAEQPDPTSPDQDAYQTDADLIGDVFFYNVMGTGPDEPLGEFSLDQNGQLALAYDKPLRNWPVFHHIEAVLEQLSLKMNGRFVSSPFWKREGRLTVTHPLGGCGVGADFQKGAIDESGRVFGANGNPLPGLYVVDGAAVPGALGVNPTFTIVAQALHAMSHVPTKSAVATTGSASAAAVADADA